MAYNEQIATTVGEVASAILAFATDRGWSVSGNQITRPGGGLPVTVTSNSNGSTQTVSVSLGVGQSARAQLPLTGGTRESGNPVQPTKVHLFGNDAPWAEEPWIAAVIECGYNSYRHIYIGNMEKLGSYTGGEVISTNGYRDSYAGSNGGFTSFVSSNLRYLFSARNQHANSSETCGGVNIAHPDNLTTWRKFRGPYLSTEKSSFSGSEVLGGHSDSINSGLLRRSASDFAGSNVLIPVNLFVPDSINNYDDVRFRPIGHCPGVRLADMRDYDPGQSVQVGNVNWRVFPEFSKQQYTSTNYGTSKSGGGAANYHPDTETSYMLGLAYPET